MRTGSPPLVPGASLSTGVFARTEPRAPRPRPAGASRDVLPAGMVENGIAPRVRPSRRT